MNKYQVVFAAIALLSLVVVSQTKGFSNLSSVQYGNTNNASFSLVTKIIDGDTIEISSGEHVRYIGIDTPELKRSNEQAECFAVEATSRNRQITLGKQVQLMIDKSDRDRFGRLLRYVYVDGILVNRILVEEGYARAKDYPPDIKMSAELRAAEKSAMNNKLGMWKACQ